MVGPSPAATYPSRLGSTSDSSLDFTGSLIHQPRYITTHEASRIFPFLTLRARFQLYVPRISAAIMAKFYQPNTFRPIESSAIAVLGEARFGRCIAYLSRLASLVPVDGLIRCLLYANSKGRSGKVPILLPKPEARLLAARVWRCLPSSPLCSRAALLNRHQHSDLVDLQKAVPRENHA